MTWTTTLNKIRAHSPCNGSWETLLRSLGKTGADDDELGIEYILDTLDLSDALWALRAVDGHEREMRLLAVSYARDVQHLMTDERSLNALDVAERHANGEATDQELAAAWAVARAAAGAAERAAAWFAARAAAWAAAGEAAWYAAWYAAGTAAEAAAWAAAWEAALAEYREKQADRLRAMLRGDWPERVVGVES